MAKKIAKVNRRYTGEFEIDTDTFKLERANMIKNLGVDDKNPIAVPAEHCHFFHTYDSNGKKMTRASAIGGHSHEVEISVDENGNLVGKCSPAIAVSKHLVGGDAHVHEVTYLKSDKLQVRKMNEDAQRIIAGMDKL